MEFILAGIILILLSLYIREKVNRNSLENEYDILDKKYIEILKDNIDTKAKTDILQNDYEELEKMQKEIVKLQEKSRVLKHDMKNHIMVIASYISSNEYEEAKKYLSRILDNLNKMYTYVHSGNSLLNHILNTKLQYAKEKDINIKAEIENDSFEKIGSIDFSILLNNLLDNAIEGSINSDGKKLVIKIGKKRGFDTILIKNSINESVLKNNPNLYTTKGNSDEHGNGLKQINSVVEKYEGMIDIYEEEKFFCVYVIYPN